MNKRIVIIGAGQAGGTAAAQLRQQGYEGEVVLIGNEQVPPYQRPPLSKAWLKGEAAATDLYMKPESFYADKQIDLRLGRSAEAIDTSTMTVRLDGETEVKFDHLVLACGARARALPNVDASVKGVHYLRSMEDASQLKSTLQQCKHLVIVGGGFIGLEVAASARLLGVKVTLLEREPRLLSRLCSETLSAYLLDLHQQQGVTILQGAELESMTQENGAVSGVQLSDGSVLECDALLVGVGSQPNIELAIQAGLECDAGVIVDEHAQTSHPAISAIGDMTQRPVVGADYLLRLESVPSSLEQAKQLALRLSEKPVANAELPWFWSDQYSTKIQMAGLTAASSRTILRGTLEDGQFSVFHFAGDTLIAAECVNAPRDFMVARKAIANSAKVNLDVLTNTEKALSEALI